MNKIILSVLTLLSVIMLFLPIIVIIIRSILHSRVRNGSWSKRLLVMTGCVILSVMLFNMAISYYENNFTLGFESMVSCFLKTLQTISLDAGYDETVVAAKEMVQNVFGLGNAWVAVIGIYASIQNLLAPIVGGATIFDILTNIFPKLRLKIAFFRKVFIFSELNERSIEIARGVNSKYRGTLIIFCDTYIDADDEYASELLIAARSLGAVCIKDDITRVKAVSMLKKRYLFVKEDMENIQGLASFSLGKKVKELKDAYVYVFCRGDLYTVIEKGIIDNIRLGMEKYYGKSIKRKEKKFYKELSEGEKELTLKNLEEIAEKAKTVAAGTVMPRITRYMYQKWEIYDILDQIPLYIPLLDRSVSPNKELNVTIFGSGKVGTQMMLETSWFAQMLGSTLAINVISDEDETKFINRIEAEYPEFLRAACENDPILSVYSDETRKKSAPYFKFRYCNADLMGDPIDRINAQKICIDINGDRTYGDKHNALDSDYYVVALGSDETNIIATERLSRAIAVRQINGKCKREVVIVCIVYDDNMSKAFESSLGYLPSNISVRVCGSLKSMFTWEKISRERGYEIAWKMHKDYKKPNDKEKTKKSDGEKAEKTVADNGENQSVEKAEKSVTENNESQSVEKAEKPVADNNENQSVEKAEKPVTDNNENQSVEKAEKPVADNGENQSVEKAEKPVTDNNENPDTKKKSRTQKEIDEFEKLENTYDYKYMSSYSRYLHLKYKIFSAFAFSNDSNGLNLLRASEGKSEITSVILDRYKNAIKADKLEKSLAWLEHRRWCAYERANGFVIRADKMKSENKSDDIALKIHPCLVECKNSADIDDAYDAKDLLDEVADALDSEYKSYDYPGKGNEIIIAQEEILRKMKEKNNVKRSKSAKVKETEQSKDKNSAEEINEKGDLINEEL